MKKMYKKIKQDLCRPVALFFEYNKRTICRTCANILLFALYAFILLLSMSSNIYAFITALSLFLVIHLLRKVKDNNAKPSDLPVRNKRYTRSTNKQIIVNEADLSEAIEYLYELENYVANKRFM